MTTVPPLRTFAATITFPVLFCRLVLLLSLFAAPAAADCECGYTIPGDAGNNRPDHVFTDLTETDFRYLANVGRNSDWVRQEFNLTREKGSGIFGERFMTENVRSNAVAVGQDSRNHSPMGKDGSAAGMQLVVGGQRKGEMVAVAEIDTTRKDMLLGSYRASMRLSDVPGTCAAFFWVCCVASSRCFSIEAAVPPSAHAVSR